MADLLVNNALIALNASKKAARRYIKKGEAADLHSFRQEMKKLHAMRMFMITTKKGKKIWHSWHHLKNFYRITSPIRESDIQRQWMQREGWEIFLLSPEVKKSEDLRSAYLDWKKHNKKTKRRLENSSKRVHPDEMVDFVRDCRSRAMLLITNNAPGEAWHQARKWIKFSIALEKIASTSAKDFILLSKKCPWVILAGLLGEWHDTEDFIGLLENNREVDVRDKLVTLIAQRERLEQSIADQLSQLSGIS